MNKRKIEALSIDQIDASGGRYINGDMVAKLALTIEVDGLLSPILVAEKDDGKYRIIAGRHRFAAVQSLGRDQIDALVRCGVSDIEIRMAELSENLHRAELTEVEQSEQTTEYADLVNQKRQQGGGQVGQDLSNVKGASGREGGDAAAARDLGVPRQQVRRSRKIAGISPEAKAAGLNNHQSALLKVAAKGTKEEQVELVGEISLSKIKGRRSDLGPSKDARSTPRQECEGNRRSDFARLQRSRRAVDQRRTFRRIGEEGGG